MECRSVSLLRIGQLAKQVGVAVGTIHYYERGGLLLPSELSAAGYRRYTTIDISRLQFIGPRAATGFHTPRDQGVARALFAG
jgi:DNA-binding transcriptional MerR regulator